MRKLTGKEMEIIRHEKGYDDNASLCPYCGILLVKVAYVFDIKEECFICQKCHEIINNIGGKHNG